ncbi:MAG: regulatory protein RecX [Clostridia bacterium]|nr:regulatory protein RecX [Clostridia bacterium]
MEFEIAKEKAVKYLVTARKTEYEVRLKLKKGKFSDDIIDQVIDYLIEIDYINDDEYVDAYIRQCMHLLNYSIFEIKQKLLQKGIKKDIIEKKVDKLKETSYETELKQKLLNGKLKNMEDIKVTKYLYRRGLLNSSNNFYEE